ncbi:MAG: hypothetical protein IGS39_06345 [Calothrix sp. C42_A2020_038]|nr:hypothetical protein [Calothrix sp. C42_A2020_038]
MTRQVSDILNILLIPLTLWLIFNLVWGRRQTGQLLRLVPSQGRYIGQVLAFLVAILLIVSAALSAREFITENNTSEGIAALSRLLFAGYMLLNGLTFQPSLTEHGIWYGNGVFIEWKKILSYEWAVDPSQPDIDILTIRASSPAPSFCRLIVKSSQQQAVDDLLRQHIPTVNA